MKRPLRVVVLLLCATIHSNEALSTVSRRDIVKSCLTLRFIVPFNSARCDAATAAVEEEGFKYASDWTGTHLELMNIETAAQKSTWTMGRWPDSILRKPAQPVEQKWFGTSNLENVASLLQKVAVDNKAVGLAAQQCGVDARVVYLENPRRQGGSIVMVNPQIVERSPETDMRVWNEFCLVLPPAFRATVLRDAWIGVEFQDVLGKLHSIRLQGETARAAQHELDHDRGVLTLDHIGLEEMENDVMRFIERKGHDDRQLMAFSRAVN